LLYKDNARSKEDLKRIYLYHPKNAVAIVAKIIAIMGSPRKNGWGAKIIEELEKAGPGHSIERIQLSEHKIMPCLGCMTCYSKGDKACPRKDDVQDIFDKMKKADAAIFLTPVYVLGMTGQMKSFFDRLSFVCHRPQFYGKNALLISYCAAFGNSQTLSALKWSISSWEYKIVGKVGLGNIMDGLTDKHKLSLDKTARRLDNALYDGMPKPGLISLIGFQLRKKGFMESVAGIEYEHLYWKEKGWLDKKAYYYEEINVNPIKRVAALLISRLVLLSVR
jgi:multimeric flavodoxin WrbA